MHSARVKCRKGGVGMSLTPSRHRILHGRCRPREDSEVSADGALPSRGKRVPSRLLGRRRVVVVNLSHEMATGAGRTAAPGLGAVDVRLESGEANQAHPCSGSACRPSTDGNGGDWMRINSTANARV